MPTEEKRAKALDLRTEMRAMAQLAATSAVGISRA
jgi:hypothetical protein